MNITEIKANVESLLVKNISILNALTADRDALKGTLARLESNINRLETSNSQLEYIRARLKDLNSTNNNCEAPKNKSVKNKAEKEDILNLFYDIIESII